MIPRLLSLAAITGTMVCSVPTAAQHSLGCDDRETLLSKLKDKYSEERIGVGVNNDGWLIELFVGTDGDTWTLVVTRPNGPACVFGVGHDWEVEPSGPRL